MSLLCLHLVLVTASAKPKHLLNSHHAAMMKNCTPRCVTVASLLGVVTQPHQASPMGVVQQNTNFLPEWAVKQLFSLEFILTVNSFVKKIQLNLNSLHSDGWITCNLFMKTQLHSSAKYSTSVLCVVSDNDLYLYSLCSCLMMKEHCTLLKQSPVWRKFIKVIG